VSTRRWKAAQSSFHQEGTLQLRAVSQVGERLQLIIVSDLPQGHLSPWFSATRQALEHRKLLSSCPFKYNTFTARAWKKHKIDFSFDLVVKEALSDYVCTSLQRVTKGAHVQWVRWFAWLS